MKDTHIENAHKRITPCRLEVLCWKEAFDVKYQATVGKGLPLCVDGHCRQTMQLTLGDFSFDFVERTTCGARYRGELISDRATALQAVRVILEYIDLESSQANREIFFPGGTPLFDLLERIAQKQAKKGETRDAVQV
jgi:hypothetical protein